MGDMILFWKWDMWMKLIFKNRDIHFCFKLNCNGIPPISTRPLGGPRRCDIYNEVKCYFDPCEFKYIERPFKIIYFFHKLLASYFEHLEHTTPCLEAQCRRYEVRYLSGSILPHLQVRAFKLLQIRYVYVEGSCHYWFILFINFYFIHYRDTAVQSNCTFSHSIRSNHLTHKLNWKQFANIIITGMKWLGRYALTLHSVIDRAKIQINSDGAPLHTHWIWSNLNGPTRRCGGFKCNRSHNGNTLLVQDTNKYFRIVKYVVWSGDNRKLIAYTMRKI